MSRHQVLGSEGDHTVKHLAVSFRQHLLQRLEFKRRLLSWQKIKNSPQLVEMLMQETWIWLLICPLNNHAACRRPRCGENQASHPSRQQQ